MRNLVLSIEHYNDIIMLNLARGRSALGEVAVAHRNHRIVAVYVLIGLPRHSRESGNPPFLSCSRKEGGPRIKSGVTKSVRVAAVARAAPADRGGVRAHGYCLS